MDLWGVLLTKHHDHPPFANHTDMYKTIDTIRAGEVPWESFMMSYKGPRPAHDVPPWMDQTYDVWFCDPQTIIKNMLGNPDFKDSMDYTPYREFDVLGSRRWEDMFSGDWAWDQVDEIAKDPAAAGCTFVPVILGSDKTTMSVATSHTEYYPLYLSIGNVRNTVRRAHQNVVALVGFLLIPKTNQRYMSDPDFQHFHRQLYHSSLSCILRSLKSGMTNCEVVRFGDGYFQRVMYGLGAYIADYPEQVLLTCIVQGWCPKCLTFRDDLNGSDTEHPVLPRCKEHNEFVIDELDLGTWWDNYGIIGNTIPFTNNYPRADIHEMIFLPDILHQLVKGTFKDHLVEWVVLYLHKVHSKDCALQILDDIDRRIAAVAPFAGLQRFPNGRGFKQWTGDDSKALMKVYIPAIEGHVPRDVVRTFPTANALAQLTGLFQTLAVDPATISHLHTRGLNGGSVEEESGSAIDGQVDAKVRLPRSPARGRAHSLAQLANELYLPMFDLLYQVRCFLQEQLSPSPDVDIFIYNLAIATFCAPSNICGTAGMTSERIQSTLNWRNEAARHDCVFVSTNSEVSSMLGMEVAWVLAFFGFDYQSKYYRCALIHWFSQVRDVQDEDTGMYIVAPDYNDDGTSLLAVVPINSLVCAAHLIPFYGDKFIPEGLKHYSSYNNFFGFYINRYADHHSFEIA
ncbi:hypothetical protein CONPUDRAFT_152917 [Coniophora puteana RWD-64-598 SS2]|uniref:Uncharacterized protein n=1 Tax=Coniophora puteana (strain RWD-64-598) TaxID=741705 RepID=A0A5M3MTZ7_CONPW|nr:uncharacterized protein CONPUDRAFT_152917 [Coniophora puteana RWD-64-598 SS2]EIW82031.1 hypothetical protein CONPUDRAFT_152917 [Coniophora puteana RWD-64-598 SS2]